MNGHVYIVPTNSNSYIKINDKELRVQLENSLNDKYGGLSKFHLNSMDASMVSPALMISSDMLIRNTIYPIPFIIPEYDPTIGDRTRQVNTQKMINN